MKRRRWLSSVYAACLMAAAVGTALPDELTSLQGTWVMDSAYEIHADGTRSTNYGEHPVGSSYR
jgi:hypothetical protein